MKRIFNFIVIAGLASQALVVGQGSDANKVLSMVREALGGDKKLASVKTITATGTSTRVNGETSSAPTDYELAMELPDKFVKKEVIATIGSNAIGRTTGFNGDGVISETDAPPAFGGQVLMRFGPGGPAIGVTPTAEQAEAMRKAALASAHEEFARFTLGMFATSFPAFPLEFSYAGQAESPDGNADVIGITGADDFAAKLFVDGATHLPLMLSWMAKEPLVLKNTNAPGRGGASGSGPAVVQFGGGGQSLTPEQRDQMVKDMQDQMKEADATRRIVEYRVYYGDYQDVSGIKLPFKIQRSIDGKASEELTLEKIKVNPRIDPKKFEVTK
jgi:hypothetical protein